METRARLEPKTFQLLVQEVTCLATLFHVNSWRLMYRCRASSSIVNFLQCTGKVVKCFSMHQFLGQGHVTQQIFLHLSKLEAMYLSNEQRTKAVTWLILWHVYIYTRTHRRTHVLYDVPCSPIRRHHVKLVTSYILLCNFIAVQISTVVLLSY